MVARLNRVIFANSFSLHSLGFGKLIIVSGIRGFPLDAQTLKQTHFPRGALSFIDTFLDSLLSTAVPLHCWSFVCPSPELNQSLGGQILIFSSFCCFPRGI